MTRANNEGHPDRNRLSVKGSAYQGCCANPWQKEEKRRDTKGFQPL